MPVLAQARGQERVHLGRKNLEDASVCWSRFNDISELATVRVVRLSNLEMPGYE